MGILKKIGRGRRDHGPVGGEEEAEMPPRKKRKVDTTQSTRGRVRIKEIHPEIIIWEKNEAEEKNRRRQEVAVGEERGRRKWGRP